MVIDQLSAGHYRWGGICEGWNLLDGSELRIVEEEMPAASSERIHYHRQAEQLFYILSGTARFTIDGAECIAGVGQAVVVKPGQRHKIINDGSAPLRFLVVSSPSTRNDRVDL